MAITIWEGRGIWEGWSIRKYYLGHKFGESVLIDPDGSPHDPGDIIRNRNLIHDLGLSKEDTEFGQAGR